MGTELRDFGRIESVNNCSIDRGRPRTGSRPSTSGPFYCTVSRYRPPTTPGSKYITPEGAKRLREELDRLWHDERPRVTLAVAEAAAQGDRSENAEYTYGKKRLHEIDRRVRFLRKRLEGMTIVDPDAGGARRDPTRVYFGAWVQIETDDGRLRWQKIADSRSRSRGGDSDRFRDRCSGRIDQRLYESRQYDFCHGPEHHRHCDTCCR